MKNELFCIHGYFSLVHCPKCGKGLEIFDPQGRIDDELTRIRRRIESLTQQPTKELPGPQY